MALPNTQVSQTPLPYDLPFFNYSGTDIPANVAVSVDASNQVGTGTNVGIGIKLVGTTGDPVVGVTMTVIPAGQSGAVRTIGEVLMFADGAITAGTWVDASGTTAKKGYAKAHGTGLSAVGIAENSTSADGDQIRVLLFPNISS